MSRNSLFLCDILPYKTTPTKGHVNFLKPNSSMCTSNVALFTLCSRDRMLQKRNANTPCPAESSILKTYIFQTSFYIHGKLIISQYVEMSHQAPHVNCFCSKWLHECSMFWPRLSLLLLADGTRYLLS